MYSGLLLLLLLFSLFFFYCCFVFCLLVVVVLVVDFLCTDRAQACSSTEDIFGNVNCLDNNSRLKRIFVKM